MKNVSILLVEDDEIDVIGVKRALSNSALKNQIVVASNGKHALEILRSQNEIQTPFLILLDLNMPCMNGIEFLEVIRKDPALDKTVVFVLSTSVDEIDKQKAYAHHVAGYLAKDGKQNGFAGIAHMLNEYSRINQFP